MNKSFASPNRSLLPTPESPVKPAIPTPRYSTRRFPQRHFHAGPLSRDFHFDTHHFVQRLEREGLTRAQSEGIMAAMADVVDESIRNLTQNMVSKVQQEKVSCI